MHCQTGCHGFVVCQDLYVSGNLILLQLRDSQVALTGSSLKGKEDPQASSVPYRTQRCSNSFNSVLQIFIEGLLCTRNCASAGVVPEMN